MTRTSQEPSRIVVGTVARIGIAIASVVVLLTSDVILGVIVGSALMANTVGLVQVMDRGREPTIAPAVTGGIKRRVADPASQVLEWTLTASAVRSRAARWQWWRRRLPARR